MSRNQDHKLLTKSQSFTSRSVQGLISVYQALNQAKVSLLLSVFGYVSVCHHQPSCSQYSLEQVRQHGTIRGFWLGFQRLITCW